MSTLREVSATAVSEAVRVDKFLSEELELTRSAIERLLEEGNVLLAGKPVKKNYRLSGGEVLYVTLPDPEPIEAEPENIPLDIVYEDADVVVVNKPAGMVVHPAAGNPSGTLVNALLYHCGATLSGVGGALRPGIVHRIDKDTSGLLVVAKHDAAHAALSKQLETHTVWRLYDALAIGNFKEDSGTVDLAIARHPVDRKRMAVAKRPGEGKPAVTHFEVRERFGRVTRLACRLETGRTHQIRVHMAHLGHPLLGDPVYGGDGTRFEADHKRLFCGQCLHAGELSFIHPVTGVTVKFHADPPEDFQRIVALLRKDNI